MEAIIANSASVFKAQFDLHTRLFNNVLEAISEEESNVQANSNTNPAKWMAGHLVGTRMGMSQFGGFEPDNKFEDFFGHDQKLDPSKAYPSIEEIKERWNEISSKISSGIGAMTEDMLDTEAPSKTPVADASMRGFMAFLMHHEAYHIGQLGLVRMYLGKSAMSYK